MTQNATKHTFQMIERSHAELISVIKYSIWDSVFHKIHKILNIYAADDHHLIGYFVDDKLVGVIGIQIELLHGVIQHISILPDFRAQGIGNRMIKHVIQLFKLTTIAAETDDDAIGFYRKFGFSDREFYGQYGKRYHCTFDIQTTA